jgi:two-component system, cell cycle sensor histidine kinase and response regulator CckA
MPSSRILPFKRSSGSKKEEPRPALRVLVVDDEAPMRHFVETVLRDAGYETTLAADGDEAIGISTQAPAFHLLVTDEMMPRMAGHQLARYMRERYLDIKVLYLSGFRDQLFRQKGSLWADEAFLDKPCTPQQLIQAVSRLMFGPLAESKPDQVDR